MTDYLRKSNALESLWGERVSAADLQAELNRIAGRTRDASSLRELFRALGDDPFLIAETLARQTLVDRKLRGRFAWDERFQGELRRSVKAQRAKCRNAEQLFAIGGEYSRVTWRLERNPTQPGDEPAPGEIVMDLDTWERERMRLSEALGGSLSVGAVGVVEETDELLSVRGVLSASEDEIVVAGSSWPKLRFDDWWRAQRSGFAGDLEPTDGLFEAPPVPATDCTPDSWTTLAFVSEWRAAHAAVWTGSEMLVWGGFSPPSGRRLNTGARYDPVTDTWTPMNWRNAPFASIRPTAVWTGTEMIVWGGSSGQATNTGGRYNPATDTWTPTALGLNLPAARQLHTAVWTGSEMIVWGGEPSFGASGLATGGRYNPATNTWLPTSGAGVCRRPGCPTPRCGPAGRWSSGAVA